MLQGSESISQYKPTNIAIWMSMAFQAGLLNIGGFMACHAFVSHVTGYATFFGYQINKGDSHRALGMIWVPLFFLFGSMVSGQLVDIRLKLHKRPKYFITFGLIFFFIGCVLIFGLLGSFGEFGQSVSNAQDFIPLALLCLTCGLQNGTITTVSKSVIRTTHLTGITTDLGLGIVRVLNRHALAKEDFTPELRANLMRLGIILFFILGSVLGGYVFSKFGYAGFIAPFLTSGLLFATMMYFQMLQPEIS